MVVYGPDKFSVLALATGVMTDLTVIPMYDRANAVVGCITEMPSPLRT